MLTDFITYPFIPDRTIQYNPLRSYLGLDQVAVKCSILTFSFNIYTAPWSSCYKQSSQLY